MKIIRPISITDSNLASSTAVEPEAGITIYSAATTYALGQLVISLTTHHIYKSLQAGNINHDPLVDSILTTPLWWVDQGADNRWKMFDQTVGSQTIGLAGSLAATVNLNGQRADTVVLLNCSCASVQVVMSDPTDGVVFNQTYSMVSSSGIIDWYAYFFEPIVRIADLEVTGIPPYATASIIATLTEPSGASVLCGTMILGLSKEIGNTQHGAQLGIQDYSVKTQDPFGNYTILQRAYNKRGVFTVWVPAGYTDALLLLLAGYRSTPIIYIGSDLYGSTIIYGFYKDFTIELTYMEISVCSIEIEGLT